MISKRPWWAIVKISYCNFSGIQILILRSRHQAVIFCESKFHFLILCPVLMALICVEAVAQRCSVNKVLLEISQNSQENICARVSFSIKLQKEALAQVLSCEFCEISKNTFSYRTPLVAASLWVEFQQQFSKLH